MGLKNTIKHKSISFGNQKLLEMFNITEEWANSRQVSYIKDLLKKEKEHFNKLQSLLIKYPKDEWFLENYILTSEKEIDKLEKRLYITKNPRFRNEIDLEELKKYPIEEYLLDQPMQENGNRLKYSCPLSGHDERTPSFVVYRDTNSYYCFGCGRGGSIIDLIMNIESCNVGEAVKKLKSLST